MADFSLTPSGYGNNYTGMLTRSIVFSGALLVFLAASGMTIASIVIPNWIAFDGRTVSEVQLKSLPALTYLEPRHIDTL
jgi:hypothetical protein